MSTLGLSYGLETVQATATPLYLALLLTPSAVREDLSLLLSFGGEMQHIVAHLREPRAALIRLQWWRDSLTRIAQGDAPPAQPVCEALARLWPRLAFSLPDFMSHLESYEKILDARMSETNDTLTLDDFYARWGQTFELCALRLQSENSILRAEARNLGAAFSFLVAIEKNWPQENAVQNLAILQGLLKAERSLPPFFREIAAYIRTCLNKLAITPEQDWQEALSSPQPLLPLRMLWCSIRG